MNVDSIFIRIYCEGVTRRETRFLNGYLPYLLRQADQTLSAPFYDVLNRYGIARSEWRVLAVLYEFDQLPVADLAVEALSPQPTVTHAVGRLEKRKLVMRTAGSIDKRQRFVSLTATGAELTAGLIDEASHLEADLLADAGDLKALADALARLTQAVQTRSEHVPNEVPHAG